MRFLAFVFYFMVQSPAFGQKVEIEIQVDLEFGKSKIELGKNYAMSNGDFVVFQNIQFYLSDLQFYKGNKKVGHLKEKALLVDLSKKNSNKIYLKSKPFNRLTFNLGLDSSTNVSGVLAGDLDPTKGMYWTWQSGYIHFKLEGKIIQTGGAEQEFVYHLGGYQKPFAAIVALEFQAEATSLVRIIIPLDSLILQNQEVELFQIMRPSVEAVEMMKTIGRLTFVTP
ncbi:MAG: hypothetical protein KJ941_09530 [Bacteroidetes bacterium]|nr:hypothetical protein [Bacteroidota bacterium]